MPPRAARPLTLAPLLAAAGAFLAGACGSLATAPAPGAEAGRYVATGLGGRALPVLTDSSADGFGVLLADTLELDGRGGARRAPVVRRYAAASRTDAVYRPQFAHEYRIAGGRITVGALSCGGANALCPAPDTGSLDGARLTLRTIQYGGRGAVLVLDRVAP